MVEHLKPVKEWLETEMKEIEKALTKVLIDDINDWLNLLDDMSLNLVKQKV